MDDAEFISYDHKNQTLIFKVEHFTKYSFFNDVNDQDQSENAQPPEEEQNADVESKRKSVDQGRFSFNPNQSRPMTSSISRNTDFEVENEEQSEHEMEVDGLRLGQGNARLGYLEKIDEDSESRMSSALAKSDEFNQNLKRGNKIQYSVQQVKEFEDHSYQEHDIDHEEEEEEIFYSVMNQKKSLSTIREEIKMKKEQTKGYIDSIEIKAAEDQKESKEQAKLMQNFRRLSKYPGPHCMIVKSVNVFNGPAPFETQKEIKPLVPYSLSDFQTRKKQRKGDIQKLEDEIKQLYEMFQVGHLQESSISEGQFIDHSQALPTIYPPKDETGLTRMWFGIVSSLKNTSISFESETKKIVDKECQILALLNACFGNSFIDLSRYMNNPDKVSRAMIEKYANYIDDNENRRRNQSISNWIKYSTRDEINAIIEKENLGLYEQVTLYLYSGNTEEATNLLLQNNKINLAMLVSQGYGQIDKVFEETSDPKFKSLIEMLNGSYVYNENVDWKANLGRILWYRDKRIQNAMAILLNPDENDKEFDESLIYKTDALAFAIL